MDAKVRESGHLMLIMPERVFYAGLLGRPRERCPGALHVYVSIKGGLRLMTADGGDACGELFAVPPNQRHTITSDFRSAICVVIEPESVDAGAFDALAGRLSGPEGQLVAGRIRAAYEQLRDLRYRDGITSAELDIMCFGEPLPPRSLDPRVVRSIAQIDTFSGGPVTAASCAAAAGLSSSRFLHLFKQETGISFRAGLEARAASAALRQSGPQPCASGTGHRLSRLDAFQPFDPPVLWPDAARDFFRLARSRDLSERPGRTRR